MRLLTELERFLRYLGGRIRNVGYTLEDLANEVDPERTPEEQYKIWCDFLEEQQRRRK